MEDIHDLYILYIYIFLPHPPPIVFSFVTFFPNAKQLYFTKGMLCVCFGGNNYKNDQLHFRNNYMWFVCTSVVVSSIERMTFYTKMQVSRPDKNRMYLMFWFHLRKKKNKCQRFDIYIFVLQSQNYVYIFCSFSRFIPQRWTKSLDEGVIIYDNIIEYDIITGMFDFAEILLGNQLVLSIFLFFVYISRYMTNRCTPTANLGTRVLRRKSGVPKPGTPAQKVDIISWHKGVVIIKHMN